MILTEKPDINTSELFAAVAAAPGAHREAQAKMKETEEKKQSELEQQEK